MQLKTVHTIKGIKSFFSGDLLYVLKRSNDSDTIQYLDDQFKPADLYHPKTEIQEPRECNGLVFTNTVADGKGIVFRREDTVETKYDFFITGLQERVGKTMVFGLKESTALMFDYAGGNVVTEFGHGAMNSIITQDAYICFVSVYRESNMIYSYDLRSGRLLWQIDLKSLNEQENAGKKDIAVSQLAGYADGKLLGTFNNGGVFIADVNTGRITGKWMDANLVRGLEQSQQESAIFWGLNHSTFLEVDASTESVRRKVDVSGILREKAGTQIFIRTARVHDSLIYFMADNKYIGLFDPATANILWLEELKMERKILILGGKDAIQVRGSFVFVLDSGGTLHILKHG